MHLLFKVLEFQLLDKIIKTKNSIVHFTIDDDKTSILFNLIKNVILKQ